MNTRQLGNAMTNQSNDPTHAITLLVALLVTASGCATPGRLLRGYAEAEPTEMALLETGGAFADAPPHLRGQVRFASMPSEASAPTP